MATVNTTSAALPTAITTGTTSLAPQSTAKQEQSQFLQLLVAQLKGQNPLDPQDPTQFVSQLAQFSSLEQLININTTLSGMTKTPATTTGNPSTNPFQGAN
jgi:flagellar basal-body rod modification protein FlgD